MSFQLNMQRMHILSEAQKKLGARFPIMFSQGDYILEVSNLSVKISDQIVLENISFRLAKGAILAIARANGHKR